MTQLTEAQHVGVLESMLQNNLDLAATSSYFFDHLANYPTFFTSAKTIQNSQLAELLASAMSVLTGRPCQLAFPNFLYLAQYELYHGPIRVPDGFATVFFFEKLELGMVTLARDDESLSYMRLSRKE